MSDVIQNGINTVKASQAEVKKYLDNAETLVSLGLLTPSQIQTLKDISKINDDVIKVSGNINK